MEGVGARLGRSSTRYGPATVFTGQVRKWKKKWIPLTPPNSNSRSNRHHHHHQTAANSGANGNNVSHLLLYKWTPMLITPNGNGTSNGDNIDESKNSNKDDTVASNEPSKRKFKYIPVAFLEEQKNEASEQFEDEAKPMETETDGVEPTSMSNSFDEKPDINDVPAEEIQAPENDPPGRQDLNESTLDLSLGLKAPDGESDSDSKVDQNKDGVVENKDGVVDSRLNMDEVRI